MIIFASTACVATHTGLSYLTQPIKGGVGWINFGALPQSPVDYFFVLIDYSQQEFHQAFHKTLFHSWNR